MLALATDGEALRQAIRGLKLDTPASFDNPNFGVRNIDLVEVQKSGNEQRWEPIATYKDVKPR